MSNNETLRTLRGIGRNKAFLRRETGYANIRSFRRDNPEYTSNDDAYRGMLRDYNDRVRELQAIRRQRERQERTLDTSRRRYGRTITGRLDRAVGVDNGVNQTIPVDMTRLGSISYIINELGGRDRRIMLKSRDKQYALNSQTIGPLEDIIDGTAVEVNEFKSGKELITSIELTDELEIIVLTDLVNALEQINGGLFNHTHNLEYVDLERYAIYHKDTNWGDKSTKDNCIIHALKTAGIDTTQVEQLVKSQYIPQKDLPLVATTINRCIHIRRPESDKLRKYGNTEDPVILIGLIDKHYFLIEKTKYTSYSIKNYFKIDIEKYPNWRNIIGLKKNGAYEYKGTRFISSYDLVKLLLENKDTHLNPLSGVEIYKMMSYKNLETELFDNLEYNDCFGKEGDLKTNDPKEDNGKTICEAIYYFDFETITRRSDGVDTIHTPYCVYSTDNINRGLWGKDCGRLLLNRLVNKHGISTDIKIPKDEPIPYIKLIAHNAGYDFRFLAQYFYSIETIEKGTGLMTARCEYYAFGKKINITIIDSLKMINMPLSKFGKSFDLEVKKEIMPYDLYTEENVEKVWIDKKECLSFVKKEDTKEYLENMKKWNCVGKHEFKNKLNILTYAGEYCKLDCIVLKQGFEKFNRLCEEAIALDTNNYISLASMSHDYLVRQGCYDDVLQICGVPRAFIQRCIVGGRCMTGKNEKYHIKDIPLADFDAVSLYPSGMSRMEGFLKGKPKIIRNFTPELYDGYFICIKITEVGRELDFPLCSYKDDKGIRQFSNDLVGRYIYIDRVGLEDLIKYQEVKYDFINGYYYNEGHNPKIKETMRYLFTQRLKYKNEDNPLQLVFKECMNSSYGKSYMKPIDNDIKYVRSKDYPSFLKRHYNNIKEITELANKQSYKITLSKPINKHYNNAHIGVEILSITKRIMNEVMVLSQDLGIKIYYQDTDSMHLANSEISKLAEAFKNEHNRELIGKNMGQFHTDFDLKGADKGCEIVATESIFLGKKAYIDKLECKNKDGTIIEGYHIRMKGVPSECITHYADEKEEGDVMMVYDRLHREIPVEFNLLAVKPKFSLNNNMTIHSKKEFNRMVYFGKNQEWFKNYKKEHRQKFSH